MVVLLLVLVAVLVVLVVLVPSAHLGMLVAEGLLIDRKRSEVDRHGLDVLLLIAECVAQVDQVRGHLQHGVECSNDALLRDQS